MPDRAWRMLGSAWFLAASGLVLAVFVVLVLNPYAAKAAAYTPAGGGFDTSFFYTARQALDRAAAFDTAGRFAYIADRWTFDLVWPPVYGAALASALVFSLARFFPGNRILRRAALAAVLAGTVLDYAENVAATVLVASVPGSPCGWAIAASIFTVSKWMVIGLAAAAALSLLAAVSVKSLLDLRNHSRSPVSKN